MKGSLAMIREMVKALSTGKMVESIEDSGKMESSMAKAFISVKEGSRELVSGLMVGS